MESVDVECEGSGVAARCCGFLKGDSKERESCVRYTGPGEGGCRMLKRTPDRDRIVSGDRGQGRGVVVC